ncbi:OsmC family protein [Alphaproteobacteria bacterium GH1-50]|uniref:OsmC family protein n=1 Tax=Kangsaoukella pontilimi TaxID=2691042 RepID=A0A7C9J3W0_9RHOB|nr:OsmC family protein [Kangsaoukella pontilimi]MXQ08441.1 OsmC family protein [Kangsaoukella pontilimi]
MKSTLKWDGGRSFTGTTEDGFSVRIGKAHGDMEKPGPSAMELILIGAGTCSAHDVVSILEKARQDVDDVTVHLSAERADDVPRVFTRIHMQFVVTGRGIKPATVERALQLSVEKYCSATRMLQATVEVTHGYEIVEAA